MRTVVYVEALAIGTGRALLTVYTQINPYMSQPCHIEMILTEGEEVVQKSSQTVKRETGEHLSSRQRGQRTRRMLTQG